MISGPLRYYAPIHGHELLTRRDLIPSEPEHARAGNWYYAFQLGPLEHKLPPIVSARWRRVTFIVTSGDRFMAAAEINDLFEQESPAGQLYVRLKELDIAVEREWGIDEEGIAYIVDLALPVENGWLPVSFGPGRRPMLLRRGQARNLPAGDPGQASGLLIRITQKRAVTPRHPAASDGQDVHRRRALVPAYRQDLSLCLRAFSRLLCFGLKIPLTATRGCPHPHPGAKWERKWPRVTVPAGRPLVPGEA
jgi:hypothetical protein